MIAAVAEDCARWSCAGDTSVFETGDFVCGFERFGEVVRDGEDERSGVRLPGFHLGDELGPQGDVEAAEGFVEQEKARAGGDCSGESNALALSAGEGGGLVVPDVVYLESSEEFVSEAGIPSSKGKEEILARSHIWEERCVVRDEGNPATVGA